MFLLSNIIYLVYYNKCNIDYLYLSKSCAKSSFAYLSQDRFSAHVLSSRTRGIMDAHTYPSREREREKTKRKTKRKDSTTSPLSEQLGTAGEPVIFRAEPAFISSCRIFSPATRSSKGASTSLCLLFAARNR